MTVLLAHAYSQARDEYDRTPWWRLIRRIKLGNEMRQAYAAFIAASIEDWWRPPS